MDPRSVNRSFLFLCIIGLLSYFSYNFVRTPVLPLFARELGAVPEMIGLIVSVSTITGIFIKFPSGIVADMIGRRLVLLIGVFIFALMPFAYMGVGDVYALIGVRAVHGLATALFAPVAMAVVADGFPTRRGEFLGWYSSSTQFGKLLGPMAGGALVGLVGFSSAFMACGLIGLLPLGLSFFLRIEKQSPPEGPIAGPSDVLLRFWGEMKTVAGDPKILVTSAMEAVQMLAAGALMAFLPIYGVTVGLTAGEVGLLFGVQGVAALVARPAMGRLSDRMGRRPLIVAGLLVCAGSFAIIPSFDSLHALLLLAAAFGMGEAIVTSSTSALVADLSRAGSLGSAMGAFGTIMDIGHASGPLLAGVLIGLLDYSMAFGLISLILLLGCALFVIMVR